MAGVRHIGELSDTLPAQEVIELVLPPCRQIIAFLHQRVLPSMPVAIASTVAPTRAECNCRMAPPLPGPGFSRLLAPTTDSFLEKLGIGGLGLPSLGKLGAVAAWPTIGRQIVEADMHRQSDAFAKNDRFLRTHARQGRQHPARGIRQGG